jgi:hypothetical protein
MTAGNNSFGATGGKISCLGVARSILRSFGNNQSTSRLARLIVRRGLSAYFHRLNRRLRAIATPLPVIFPPDFFRHC